MSNDILFILKARNDARRVLKNFGGDLKKSAAAADDVKDEMKAAARNADQLARNSGRIKKPLRQATTQAKLLNKATSSAARSIGGLISAFAGTAFLAKAIQEARSFNAALSETSTLIEGTPEQLALLEKEASRLVRTFGGSGAAQLEGFYQTISSGIDDVAEASKVLETANKLAVGGVTTVTNAVDILTTAVNAYGPEVITAEQASDSLFVAVRAGKTTVDQLGSSLGRVIPFATQTGVSFQEVTSAVAALTTQGISTNEAVTGLRAILASILKPSQEARDVAKAVGVEFNTAALEAKGLEGFLADLVKQTGGNRDALALLFGSTEAIAPAFALAGRAGDKFREILKQNETAAGETQTAYEKVSAELNQRLNVATGDLLDIAREVGTLLLTVLVPALEGLVTALRFAIDNVDGLVLAFKIFIALSVPRIIAAIIVSFGKLVGAIKLASLALVGPGGLVAAIKTVQKAFKALFFLLTRNPLVAFAVAAGAAFLTLSGKLDPVIQKVSGLIRLAAIAAEELLSLAGIQANLSSGGPGATRSPEEQARLQNDITPTNEERRIDRGNSGLNMVDTDGNIVQVGISEVAPDIATGPVGGETGDAGRSAEVAAILAGLGADAGAGGGGGSTSGAGGGGGATEQLNQIDQARKALNETIQQTIQGYRDETELLGLYGEELDFARQIQDLQNEARRNGITLTEQQIALIERERLALESARGAADTFTNGLKAGLAAINEELPTTVEFTVGLMKQAFDGLSNAIVDLVTTGKADFRGLLTSLLTSISKFLADRLVANFMNGLFGGPAGGGGGGGGLGGGGGFLGIIGKIFGKAASTGMKAGGKVVGPGSGTSDSIPRMLSNGEFVVNAKAAKQNMALLQAINGNRTAAGAKLLGMAQGGVVRPSGEAAMMRQLLSSQGDENQRVVDTVRQLQGADTSPTSNGGFAPTINFNFPSGDADSFRRSEAQVRSRMYRVLDDANSRNN